MANLVRQVGNLETAQLQLGLTSQESEGREFALLATLLRCFPKLKMGASAAKRR
jgi:hypothetical protein